jgi:hypothetical protein
LFEGAPAKVLIPKILNEFSFGIGMVNTEKYRPIPTEKTRLGMQLYYWSEPRIILCLWIPTQSLICVCACDSFVCGPRIKFCALAQTWVVTQSLVSEKRSDWLTPW